MNFKKMGAFSKASVCSDVLEDVPAYATVQGNPTQIIKQYKEPPQVSLYSLSKDGQDT